MNWKAMGLTLLILGGAGGMGGLLLSKIVEAPRSQQARWAVDCFDGDFSGCQASTANETLVRQWTDYGTSLAIGSAVLAMLGAGLFAGAVFSPRPEGAQAAATEETDDLTPEQLAEAEVIERELALRGFRR